jgi:CheY-like chemotaxis protein
MARREAEEQHGRHNTLNLSADRLDQVMNDLDEANAAGSVRRDHSRISFRKPTVEVEVFQPSGGSVNFCVASRNLSRGGLSAVHSSYMHVGSKCRVKMLHKTEGEQWLAAEVVQCRHVSGRIHDVGFRFAKEIDVNDYVRVDPLSQTFSLERVDPSKLSGRILLVTENEIDRKLVEVYLSETSLRMIHVKTYDEILPQFTVPFDLVLCDFDMDTVAASRGIQQMRAAGHAIPVIAIAGGITDPIRSAIRESRASALLPKPIERIALLRALAEFILLGRGAGEDIPQPQAQLDSDPSLRALAEQFASDLQGFAEGIGKCVASGDEKTLRYICARIRGSGPLLGYGSVAEAAGKVLARLDAEDGTIASASESINTLTSLCKLARAA